MEIRTGDPSVEGRYVVWKPSASRQISDWCEPSIATWHGGKWHSFDAVHCWTGPLPVVNTKTGEVAEQPRMIVATNAAGALKQLDEMPDLLDPDQSPIVQREYDL